ncbi:MAG: DEAD/DEAH box helicase [Bacteroidetes bacterium]|nr:DEAD/DEAH box helicase [Bacteroidota bacterium]
MTFESLNLIEPIKRALVTEGYIQPTPIQEKSIPVIMQGKDLLGCAQTGTGKTAAFAIPILQLLHKEPSTDKWRRKIKALIITPTRELAIQIGESFDVYGRYIPLKNTVVYGGVHQKPQTNALQRGIDILIATPGRLQDLMDQGYINLQAIEIVVLDEADRMLDMGFINDVKRIMSALPAKRQSLFFCATIPPEILKLAGTILKQPEEVLITPVTATTDLIGQSVYFVSKADKNDLLIHVLKDETISNALVFTRTKYGADKVERLLNKKGIKAEAIHGNKSQSTRQKALQNFKNRETRVLVASDIASRGIDVEELSCVINFDIPNIPETYVHRIGRTGRAGASGIALSFCDTDEKTYLRDISKLISRSIPVVSDHPYPLADQTPLMQHDSQKFRRPYRNGTSGFSRHQLKTYFQNQRSK